MMFSTDVTVMQSIGHLHNYVTLGLITYVDHKLAKTWMVGQTIATS